MAKVKLEISFEIDKDKWTKAIQEGWKERFGKEVSLNDIKELHNVSDFVWAVPHLSETDIEDLTVDEQ